MKAAAPLQKEEIWSLGGKNNGVILEEGKRHNQFLPKSEIIQQVVQQEAFSRRKRESSQKKNGITNID